jgi:hypothetical protein
VRRPSVSWVHWAVVGLALGLLFRASWAFACECYDPPLRLQLSELTSTNPDVSHEACWPELAEALGYQGAIEFTAEQAEPGQTRNVECADFGR